MTALPLFAGEDILAARCEDSEVLSAKVELFRQAGVWDEVVRGMTDLTVKYDPLAMSDAEAEQHFRNLWDAPISAREVSKEPLILDASFAGDDAPDMELVAAALRVGIEALPAWLGLRSYRVTMMGFQPGFAYLEDVELKDLPTLPRLATPRQRVAAGSIGFLGERACIYALDGPGGWPIIGRVRDPLFRRDDPQRFLLEPGQIVRFRPL
jgi:KipI family sensor histidine kinase inhibitor